MKYRILQACMADDKLFHIVLHSTLDLGLEQTMFHPMFVSLHDEVIYLLTLPVAILFHDLHEQEETILMKFKMKNYVAYSFIDYQQYVCPLIYSMINTR